MAFYNYFHEVAKETGGIIRSRPPPRSAATTSPSARPSVTACAVASGCGSRMEGRWMSGLTKPAAGFLAKVASIFCKTHSCLARALPATSALLPPQPLASLPALLPVQPSPRTLAPELGFPRVGYPQDKITDADDIMRLQKLLKQKTFTRAEVDGLSSLLSSRIVEFDASKPASSDVPLHFQDDVASLIELAKIYMRSRSSCGFPMPSRLHKHSSSNSSNFAAQLLKQRAKLNKEKLSVGPVGRMLAGAGGTVGSNGTKNAYAGSIFAVPPSFNMASPSLGMSPGCCGVTACDVKKLKSENESIGPIRRKSERNNMMSPYARPPVIEPNATDGTSNDGCGWLSRLVLPTSRSLLASRATQLFSSIFSNLPSVLLSPSPFWLPSTLEEDLSRKEDAITLFKQNHNQNVSIGAICKKRKKDDTNELDEYVHQIPASSRRCQRPDIVDDSTQPMLTTEVFGDARLQIIQLRASSSDVSVPRINEVSRVDSIEIAARCNPPPMDEWPMDATSKIPLVSNVSVPTVKKVPRVDSIETIARCALPSIDELPIDATSRTPLISYGQKSCFRIIAPQFDLLDTSELVPASSDDLSLPVLVDPGFAVDTCSTPTMESTPKTASSDDFSFPKLIDPSADPESCPTPKMKLGPKSYSTLMISIPKMAQ